MIDWEPTAAEEAIIQAGTDGLKVDRLLEDGTLRFRVERDPDPATVQTLVAVALRCTEATGIVFAVLSHKTTTRPQSQPAPMGDPSAEGSAVIADQPRKMPATWCDMRHAGHGDCCGRVLLWVGETYGEYGEPLLYPRHPWSSQGAGMGYACEAHLAEASAPEPYREPALAEDAPTLRLIVREEPAGCSCCYGDDVAALVCPVTGREVAQTADDAPGPKQDAARWARMSSTHWSWNDKALDLATVRIVDGR